MTTFVNIGSPVYSYGLGLEKFNLSNGMSGMGHTGGTAGYTTFALYFPNEDITATSVVSAEVPPEIQLAFLLPSLDLIHGYDER